MTTEANLKQAAELLAPWTTETTTPEDFRLDVWLAGDDIPAAIKTLHEAGWGYLATITGIDHGGDDGMEAMYHFCNQEAVATLRVRFGYDSPSVPSICDTIPSASFFERELMEMFGITVVDTPNTDHLFLPDDWPENTYPLRKDFEMKQIQGGN
jgi:Ni,Fe-hydrogenase III component G